LRRKSDKSLQVIAVRIDPTIEKRLRLLSDVSGHRQSFFLKQIIEQGIDAMEDAWLPENVLAEVRSGKLPVQQREPIRDLFGDVGEGS
jgi:RHH-type transcriptional regulator, rel operon repressor / antitoxin RelB